MRRLSVGSGAPWDALVSSNGWQVQVGPDEDGPLPGPGRRLLSASTLPDAAQPPTVVLRMEGRIRLGTWMPFTALQVLSAGCGFLWMARVGRGPIVVTGHDSLVHGVGDLDFRLWGLVPVARARGPDIDRSTIGRLAAETVVWAPGALTPALGAAWSGIDDRRAVVTVPVGGERVDVTVDVDDDGHATDVTVSRWGNPDGGAFGWHSFGASMTDWAMHDGVTIGTRGIVGWHWDAPERRAPFFEWAVTDACFPQAHEATRALAGDASCPGGVDR